MILFTLIVAFTNIRLVDSPHEAPNAGRIQVYNANQWLDVCHDSDDEFGNRDWSFSESMVVCRQLGYPGTAMIRKGGYGNATGPAISSFSCDGGTYLPLYVESILLNFI